MYYKYREGQNLLGDRRLNAEQVAKVIDIAKTIDGAKWIFRRVDPFKSSDLEELEQLVRDWFSQKKGISHNELKYFDIPLRPEGYNEGSYENVIFNVEYKEKSGIEIVQCGFSRGFMRIHNNPSFVDLAEISVCGSGLWDLPPLQRIYAVEAIDVADLVYDANNSKEAEIVEKAKQYQPKLVKLLSNNMPAPIKCVPVDLLLK